jgi:hypothetical protein
VPVPLSTQDGPLVFILLVRELLLCRGIQVIVCRQHHRDESLRVVNTCDDLGITLHLLRAWEGVIVLIVKTGVRVHLTQP